MPQPTPYSPSVDFSAEEANNVGGRSTVRTAPLDAELSAIAATLQGVLANLALNQRDDGEIRDQRVKLHTLSQDVRALLTAGNVTAANVRGAWVTATTYVKLDLVSQGGNTYICAAAHTAGTFATDLAAGRWLLVALGAATAASAVPFTATTNISATNVQAAIEEADTENRALSAAASASVVTALADLASTASGKGSALVGYLPPGTGAATTRDVQDKLREVAVTPEDYLAPGESITTDAGPAIRRALATGHPVRFVSAYVVDYDPASGFNDGGTTRYTYTVKVPSNAVLIFEDGASITQKAGAQRWTRTVSFQEATNVRVFGELRVDANVANVGAATNEHMHGVFLFNTTETYIERIDSRNARGDNVFIGGTDENTNSRNVYIGSIRAVKAGRKNLVLQHFDNVHIGVADLDNSTGGAAIYAGGVPDDTDKHSLDLEPDIFTGAVFMRAWIGRLTTKGTGNDFTAGTTDVNGRACVLTIDSMAHQHTSSTTVRPWIQNACTINVGEMTITGVAGIATPFLLQYAAYLNVDDAYIQGSTPGVSDAMILAAVVLGGRPRVRFGHLHLVNSAGAGFENRDADFFVGKYRAETAGIAFWGRCTSSTAGLFADTRVDEVEMADVGQPAGAGYAILHSLSGSQVPITSIGRIRFADSRTPKLNFIVSVGSGAAAGLTLGEVDNPTAVAVAQFQGADKFYRLGGGGGFPAPYVGTGTPEAMVAAPIGSTFLRTDGGAGTSFYVKQSGTGNTGWVGK